MSKKPFENDIKIDVIDRFSPYTQESFDLARLDNFVSGLGVEYFHYKSFPSPIGKNDRGDYRRNNGVDTISSNGMLYKCSGKFTATMTDNTREKRSGASGNTDPSESFLVLPRFYDKEIKGDGKGDRIYLAPGDRIYVADPNVDVLVSNSQEMDFEEGDNVAMFPIVKMEVPLTDSRNIEYIEGVDYTICDGNIKWLAGGKNPGIDPSTGKGRVYSVRYLYKSYWYITKLPKEVRITNVTNANGDRVPERASYHATTQREYMYHNQNKGSKTNQLKSKDPKRAAHEPVSSVNPSKYSVPVDMSGIGDDEEQS